MNSLRCCRTALLCVISLSLGVAWGQAEDGGIRIRSAAIALEGSTAELDVSAEIALPPEIRAGLNSGVPLEFILELRLKRPRQWLPDANLATFQRRYSLIYYELTRHYRVRTLDADVSRNYRSLLPALEALGDLQDVMISIPEKLAEKLDHAQFASVQIRLNTAALPLPLQPVFSSTWRLTSKEYQWPIN